MLIVDIATFGVRAEDQSWNEDANVNTLTTTPADEPEENASDSVVSSAAIEFGDVEVNHTWSRVLFQRDLTDPVGVAGAISLNGG